MAIERTDEWLKKNFHRPLIMCEKLLPYFETNNPRDIYEYLLSFGMYRPSWSTERIFQALVESKTWDRVAIIFKKYQDKWQGPEVPVYIFPKQPVRSRSISGVNKSGVSFKDKLFLFLTDIDDEKELEAVFVHEYHHICRMNKQKKHIDEYTLLDSIILEGLAEHAVKVHCGEQYVANWCDYYSKDEMKEFWGKFIKPNLSVKKHDRIHNELLFGHRKYPPLLGYAIGYELVKQSDENRQIPTKNTFILPSEYFVNKKIFETP